jgi:hypothetical protein
VAGLALCGVAPLWVAVLADCGTLLLVLANSGRPAWFSFEDDTSVEMESTETSELIKSKEVEGTSKYGSIL